MIESLMIILGIIFIVIALIPIISKKIGLPTIVIEIILGIILGKSLLDIIPSNSMIAFFSSFGLIYLMFLAGLDVNFAKVRKYFSRTILIALASVLIPFIVGYSLAPTLGVNAFFLGAIFSTTSLGIILPMTKELKKKREFVHVLLGSVVLVDIISMFILAFSLSFIEGSLGISFIYSLIAILILFIVPWLINKWNIQKKIEVWVTEKTHFEMEVRFSFALIFVFAIVSESLGFHAIIGAFIAGLIISELTPKALLLEKKLEGFGYGFFIPMFFIFMGAKVDLPLLFSNLTNIKLLLLIIVAGILAKLLGVGVLSLFKGFNLKESTSMGLLHAARLSLIIAAAEIGSIIGIIDNNLFSIFVILAVVSSTIAPSLGKYLLLGKFRN